MHNQGSIRATVTLGFPELRSRRGGKGALVPWPRCVLVATLTRHTRSARPVPAPVSCSAALLVLLHALGACLPTFLELLSARVPLSLLSCSRSTSSVVDIARRHWRRAGDKLVVPHTFPWIKRATEQRAAARFPLLSVPQHTTQREMHAQRTLASTLSAPGGRPMLRPGALLSMSLCLLVQRSSGCAHASARQLGIGELTCIRRHVQLHNAVGHQEDRRRQGPVR